MFIYGCWESHFIFLFEGPFHLPSVEFILSGLDLSFSNSNKEMVKEIATDDRVTLEAKINYVNTWEYFTLAELEGKNVQSIGWSELAPTNAPVEDEPVRPVLRMNILPARCVFFFHLFSAPPTSPLLP
jgi:hypothetical protein